MLCKQLFDKNVLEIKKLVKDIGDLTPLIHKERKKIFYMMTAILLLPHFLVRLIKRYSVMDLFHQNITVIMKSLYIQKID